jgi:lactaldehyde dehydrogenase/glycolaldehyde dehydrogenase
MDSINTEFKHYIGGQFVTRNQESISVFNPASERQVGVFGDGGDELALDAVAAARTAQNAWALIPAHARGQYLRKIAQSIRANLPRLARVITMEQGKVLGLAELEVALSAEYLDYYAEWGRRIEGEIITSDRPNENMFLFRRPVGVVAGILPWNFPFFMIVRKVAPALITGNTIVIKPSEETPYSAYEFARIIDEVELPPGVFNLVGGLGNTVGQTLVGHPDVDMVSFTGSSAAGAAIMANAARNVTKVSLELGGKAPCIVLADANLDLAVAAVRGAKTMNSGQACNCAERVYVERSVYAEFAEKLSASLGSISYGDPLGERPVEMGPLINRAAVERIRAMLDDARAKGGEILVGGKAFVAGEGCYVQPTLVAGATADMHLLQREVFGPVALVEPVEDLDEAIFRANDTEYGLTSSIFTSNLNAAF